MMPLAMMPSFDVIYDPMDDPPPLPTLTAGRRTMEDRGWRRKSSATSFRGEGLHGYSEEKGRVKHYESGI
jgi:hypothetical protein